MHLPLLAPSARVATLVAAAVAAATLLGCSATPNLTDDTLDRPSVTFGDPIDPCAAPSGSATIELSVLGTRIVENAPAQTPINRAEVDGVVSGTSATDRVLLLKVRQGTTCPVLQVVDLGAIGDGAFTGHVGLGMDRDFRIVGLVIADAAAADLACDAAADCLGIVGTGTIAAVSLPLRIQRD